MGKDRDIKYFIINITAPLLLSAVLLAGCTKRDLETYPTVLEISLEWPEGVRPTAAHLHIYHEDGNLLEIHEGLTDGYQGSLPPGNYMLIAHNQVAEHVAYDNIESHHQAVVYATTPDGRESTESCFLVEPHNVYGIGQHNEGTTFSVCEGDTTHLVVMPDRLTKNVRLHFNVKGIYGVTSLGGSLSGVSPSVLLCTCTSVPLSCLMSFEAEMSQQDQWLAALELFDLLAGEDSAPGTNNVNVVLEASGNRYGTVADITPALKDIIKGNGGTLPQDVELRVTLYFGPLGVLTATVTPWEEVEGGEGEI